jgi:hypothetical protein
MANTPAVLAQLPVKDLVIRQNIIPWSNPNRPGTKLYPAPTGLWMVQHTTGNRNDYADAESHAVFVIRDMGGPDNVSFNLCVDNDSTQQFLPLDECGYHAGDGMNNYWQDVGGFGGISMELCVNYDAGDNPVKWLEAKQRAVATWAAVMQGDPRFDWGTRPKEDTIARLSLLRYVPHRRVSDDLKWCPEQLLDEKNMDPWTGDGPMKDAIRIHLGEKPPVAGTTYPDGMDAGIAKVLFGECLGDDKVMYRYNEKGPVSQLWLEVGKREGTFPEITHVRNFDTRKYFVFNNGMVIWSNNGGAVQEMK